MSLKHLYFDLNHLGVYPDVCLPFVESLKGYMVRTFNMGEYVIHSDNTYYGFRVYLYHNLALRKMYLNGKPSVVMSMDSSEGHRKLYTMTIIQGCDVFKIHMYYTYCIIQLNDNTMEMKYYTSGNIHDMVHIIRYIVRHIRNIKTLDEFKRMLLEWK